MSRLSFVYRVTDHPFANCLSVAPPPWLYLGKADRNGDRKDYPTWTRQEPLPAKVIVSRSDDEGCVCPPVQQTRQLVGRAMLAKRVDVELRIGAPDRQLGGPQAVRLPECMDRYKPQPVTDHLWLAVDIRWPVQSVRS